MNSHRCPTEQLKKLIRNELTATETDMIQSHLDTCELCQHEIEQLAAEPSWWTRVSRSLSDHSVPTHPQLPNLGDSIIVQVPPGSAHLGTVPGSSLLDAPGHPEMLGRIDEFDVEEKLGQGGMGVVFRGFDSSLNRPVAIKVLAPHLATSGVARKRFAREAQAAAAVVHPNVVPIYSVKDSPERPYIVMALVDGRSLQDHIAEHGPLPVKDIVRIAHQIAAGLAEAHKQGLVHRDIKPANILLEKDVSRVLITDFGLARAADDVAMTQTGWLAGTPHYMSPEQARGNDIDLRSDLFSLGSVIYFMATGREPFRAEKPLAILQKIDQDSPIPARNINSEIPKTLDQIVLRLLEKNPDDRIESAGALEQLLARYLAHLQHPQSIAKPVVRASVARRKRIRHGVLIAASVLILVAGLSWALIPKNSPKPQSLNSNTTNTAQNSDADPTQWMNHLQPFHQWNSEVDELAREIDDLERQLLPELHVPNGEVMPDSGMRPNFETGPNSETGPNVGVNTSPIQRTRQPFSPNPSTQSHFEPGPGNPINEPPTTQPEWSQELRNGPDSLPNPQRNNQ